jgi:ferrous iron transport protein A
MTAARHNGHPFPLTLAGIGERLRIVTIDAGKGLHRRLGDLGLPLGSEIAVVQRQGGGIVVSRDSARVALGATMVGKVMVARIGDTT